MAIIGTLLLVIFVISAILLIIIVMMQDEQGEGLGGIFGGGSNASFGSRSGNILTKTTSILGAIFILSSLGNAWINRTTSSGDVLGVAREEIVDTTTEWWNNSVGLEGSPSEE
ncbi:MAG: preprotein translocase subunit SecG [Spirochaetales bacterium]|nr:preprotein translocase subunit SecG [Spirochaetales bacterium]